MPKSPTVSKKLYPVLDEYKTDSLNLTTTSAEYSPSGEEVSEDDSDLNSHNLSAEIKKVKKPNESDVKHEAYPSFSENKNTKKSMESPILNWFYVSMVLLLSVVVLYLVKICSEADCIGDWSTQRRNCSGLLELEERYPEQGKFFWKTLRVQIDHVLNDIPPQPAVVFFVHSNNRKARHLIEQITVATATCLDSRGGAILLNGIDFQRPDIMNDYGVVISNYLPKLKTKKVMYVNEVSEIPVTVVPAFHVFCDKYTPAVAKAIIYFTLEMDPDEAADEALYDITEKKLEKLWKNGMHKDKIQPLITRMTETILHVKV